MTSKLAKNFLYLLAFFVLMVLIPVISVYSFKKSGDFSARALEPKINISKINKKNEEEENFLIYNEQTGEKSKISVREFLYGAVAAEMPIEFEPEALKAQTVAINTYFEKAKTENVVMGLPKNEDVASENKNTEFEFSVNTPKTLWFFTNEQMKEKWGENFSKNLQKIKASVNEVFGEIIVDNDEPILAVFHSMSSGTTEKCKDVFGKDIKYLQNVSSPGDKLANKYLTTVEVSVDDFKNIVLKKFEDIKFTGEPANWIKILKKTDYGFVKETQLLSKKVTGPEIRWMFLLRSSNFDVEFKNNKFIFNVRGYGHGVGMSQYGANHMAKEGSDYKQIISWYYPNTKIKQIYS